MIDLTGKSILVVDDEEDFRKLIGNQLELRGATVSRSSNGVDAFRLVTTQAMDLVITDIRMPGENADGVTLFKKIEEKFKQPPPIILVTGYSDCGEEHLFSLGASAILSKPFSFKELEERIGQLLKLDK